VHRVRSTCPDPDRQVLPQSCLPSPQLAYALTQIIWKAYHHPEWFEYFNCAILFNSAYPSCIVMAYASAVNLLSNVLTWPPSSNHRRPLHPRTHLDLS
jgi:hypothetical protein